MSRHLESLLALLLRIFNVYFWLLALEYFERQLPLLLDRHVLRLDVVAHFRHNIEDLVVQLHLLKLLRAKELFLGR